MVADDRNKKFLPVRYDEDGIVATVLRYYCTSETRMNFVRIEDSLSLNFKIASK